MAGAQWENPVADREPASLVATRSPGVIPGRSAHRDDGGLGTGSNGLRPARWSLRSSTLKDTQPDRSCRFHREGHGGDRGFLSTQLQQAAVAAQWSGHAATSAQGGRVRPVHHCVTHIVARAHHMVDPSSPNLVTFGDERRRRNPLLSEERGRKTLGRWPGDCCGALGGARDFQPGFNEELRVGFDRLLNRVGDPWQSTLPGGEGEVGLRPRLSLRQCSPLARDGRSRSPAVSVSVS